MARVQMAKVHANGSTFTIIKKDGLFFLYEAWRECGYDKDGRWITKSHKKLVEGRFEYFKDAILTLAQKVN